MAPLGKKIIVTLLLILGSLSIFRTTHILWNSLLPDFSIFYISTKALLEGDNPYLLKDLFTQLNYPPTSLMFFIPLAFFSLSFASKIWILVSICFFVVSVYFLHIITKSTLLHTSFLFFIFAISFPLKFTLGMGQVNMLLLLALTLFLYFIHNKREKVSAIFLSLSVIVKLYPALFYLLVVITKRWKILGVSVLIILFITLISLLLIDSKIYMYYLNNILIPLLTEVEKGEYYNQALSATFKRFGIEGTSVFLRLILLIITMLVISKRGRIFERFSLLLITILLINAFTWQHHLVLMLIPAFILIKEKSKTKLTFLIIGLALIISNMKNVFSNNDLINSIYLSHVTIGMVIIWILQFIRLQNEVKKP